MLKSNLPEMSLEQRQENLEKARNTRLENIAKAEETLKMDWHSDDEKYWLELANIYSVKLPQKHKPITAGIMRKYAKLLDLADGYWEEAFFGEGYKNITNVLRIEKEAWIKATGKVPNARAYIGWLLEMRQSL